MDNKLLDMLSRTGLVTLIIAVTLKEPERQYAVAAIIGALSYILFPVLKGN